jgi:hypothetical protein
MRIHYLEVEVLITLWPPPFAASPTEPGKSRQREGAGRHGAAAGLYGESSECSCYWWPFYYSHCSRGAFDFSPRRTFDSSYITTTGVLVVARVGTGLIGAQLPLLLVHMASPSRDPSVVP